MYRQRTWCEIVLCISASSKALVVPYSMLLLGNLLQPLGKHMLIAWALMCASLVAEPPSRDGSRPARREPSLDGPPGLSLVVLREGQVGPTESALCKALLLKKAVDYIPTHRCVSWLLDSDSRSKCVLKPCQAVLQMIPRLPSTLSALLAFSYLIPWAVENTILGRSRG